MSDEKLMLRGAKVIIGEWMELKPKEALLIVSTSEYKREVDMMKQIAEDLNVKVDVLMAETGGQHVGEYFDINTNVFDPYDAIIGATEYSLVTTEATKRAIEKKKKYLSLPLSTNDGRSLLAYDFLLEDTKKSKYKAYLISKQIKNTSVIRITTESGTDLKTSMLGRKPGFFNGKISDGLGYSSSSFEIYIPIVENATEGTLIVDGSYGYLGKVRSPFEVRFKNGRIAEIEDSPAGNKLRDYMVSYQDPNIYVAGELGIGLNTLSRCLGDCYIEDESTYGTFHIGVGRNIALGGIQDASGHFDLVSHRPNIYFDNILIMDHGQVTIEHFYAYF